MTQPTLRTGALNDQSAPEMVLEAYVLDLADWVAYAKKLDGLLDVYRQPSPPPAAPK